MACICNIFKKTQSYTLDGVPGVIKSIDTTDKISTFQPPAQPIPNGTATTATAVKASTTTPTPKIQQKVKIPKNTPTQKLTPKSAPKPPPPSSPPATTTLSSPKNIPNSSSKLSKDPKTSQKDSPRTRIPKSPPKSPNPKNPPKTPPPSSNPIKTDDKTNVKMTKTESKISPKRPNTLNLNTQSTNENIKSSNKTTVRPPSTEPKPQPIITADTTEKSIDISKNTHTRETTQQNNTTTNTDNDNSNNNKQIIAINNTAAINKTIAINNTTTITHSDNADTTTTTTAIPPTKKGNNTNLIVKIASPITERVRGKIKHCTKVESDDLTVEAELHNSDTKPDTLPSIPAIEHNSKSNENITQAFNTSNITVNITSPNSPNSPNTLKSPVIQPSTSSPSPNLTPKTPLPRKKMLKVSEGENVTTSENSTQSTNETRRRKSGIMADRAKDVPTDTSSIDVYPKDQETEELIKKAIRSNDFLNNMMDSNERLDLLVKAMKPRNYSANSFIINEGEKGSHFYVSASGEFEVLQNRDIKGTFGAGIVFGELAILYKAPRLASIHALTNANVWELDRKVFQNIMIITGSQEREQNIKFLSSVQLLEKMDQSVLVKISNLLRREFYATGTSIVTQGDEGDKFYIIRGGTVTVKKKMPSGEVRTVNNLRRGDYFGEQALIKNECRLASVIADAPGAECLTLDRAAFTNYLGNLKDIMTQPKDPPNTIPPKAVHRDCKVKLEDLEIVGTLGVGGFGRVELVQNKGNETYALKILKKYEVCSQNQIEHAFSEKYIMEACDSIFIVKLFKTYKDTKYLYFLMEPCLGGDVWTQLQKRNYFDETTAKFITGCVVQAFDYLHSRDIIYRDLKPENLMLDKDGYVKLVDFGFSKQIKTNQKTWTFAGTPEYVAPEIILNKGHDRSVDYWALGVLVHELLVGKPPFRGKDHMKTYKLILRGIDVVQMSQRIQRNAQNLIKSLCKQIPTERLGYQKDGIDGIRKHPWFHKFEWTRLNNRSLNAPLKCTYKSSTDLSNFDEYPRDRDDPPEDTSGWDEDF